MRGKTLRQPPDVGISKTRLRGARMGPGHPDYRVPELFGISGDRKSLNSEESDEKPESRAEHGAGPPSGRQPTKYGQPGPRIPASLLFRITPILMFA